jgi:hypothetical protein
MAGSEASLEVWSSFFFPVTAGCEGGLKVAWDESPADVRPLPIGSHHCGWLLRLTKPIGDGASFAQIIMSGGGSSLFRQWWSSNGREGSGKHKGTQGLRCILCYF